MGYDQRCYDLAEVMWPEGTSQQLKYIAQEIQDAIENALDTMPCKRCGEFECQCDQPVEE